MAAVAQMLLASVQPNAVSNPTAAGGVAGALNGGGSMPTGWSAYDWGSLSVTLAYGTDGGIPYMDFAVQGTVPSIDPNPGIVFNPNIAAANGQAWQSRLLVKLQAGSLTGVSGAYSAVVFNDSSGNYLEGWFTALAPTTTTLSGQSDVVTSMTASMGSDAFVAPYMTFNLQPSAFLNFTLRIANPRLYRTA